MHHENVLREGEVDSDDVTHLVADLELGGIHRGVEVEVVEEQDPRATIARALAFALTTTIYLDRA